MLRVLWAGWLEAYLLLPLLALFPIQFPIPVAFSFFHILPIYYYEHFPIYRETGRILQGFGHHRDTTMNILPFWLFHIAVCPYAFLSFRSFFFCIFLYPSSHCRLELFLVLLSCRYFSSSNMFLCFWSPKLWCSDYLLLPGRKTLEPLFRNVLTGGKNSFSPTSHPDRQRGLSRSLWSQTVPRLAWAPLLLSRALQSFTACVGPVKGVYRLRSFVFNSHKKISAKIPPGEDNTDIRAQTNSKLTTELILSITHVSFLKPHWGKIVMIVHLIFISFFFCFVSALLSTY